MKIILSTILSILLIFNFKELNAQTINKGNIIFSGYYGVTFSQFYVKDYSSIGPIGARAEFCFNRNFSLGLEYSYKNEFIKKEGPLYGNPENTWGETHTYSKDVQSINLHMNYFLLNSNSFNVALTGGIGRNIISKSYSMSDEDDSDPFVGHGIIFDILEPISIKLKITTSYYFTKNLGANISVGLGQGGLVNGGLVYKINN